MTLGNPYNQSELNKIRQNDNICLVDKHENPDRYKKSMLLMMDTKQAKEIRDFLTSQIKQYSDDRVGVGLLIHTGKCA